MLLYHENFKILLFAQKNGTNIRKANIHTVERILNILAILKNLRIIKFSERSPKEVRIISEWSPNDLRMISEKIYSNPTI